MTKTRSLKPERWQSLMTSCAQQVERPGELELALWFHDAVYDPHSDQNEKLSADWAADFLADCGAEYAKISRVHRLVMVTEHNAPTENRDEAILGSVNTN